MVKSEAQIFNFDDTNSENSLMKLHAKIPSKYVSDYVFAVLDEWLFVV